MAERKRWVFLGQTYAPTYAGGHTRTIVWRIPKRRKPLVYPTHRVYFRHFWNTRWRPEEGIYNQERLDERLAQLTREGEVLRESEVEDFLHQRDPLRDLYCGEDEGC